MILKVYVNYVLYMNTREQKVLWIKMYPNSGKYEIYHDYMVSKGAYLAYVFLSTSLLILASVIKFSVLWGMALPPKQCIPRYKHKPESV